MQQFNVRVLCHKATAMLSAILVLALFSGCSGGGSGPPPTLNYTGVTTPVTITAENAETILLGAYEGGHTASVFNIFGAAQAESTQPAARPRILLLAEALETFLYELDLENQSSTVYAGALISDSKTISGSCGGSVYYDVDLDSIFGDFSGTADFRNYCDANNPDLILDGIADFSGDYEIFSQEIDDFTFICRDLRVDSDQGSYILNGSLFGTVSMSSAVLNTNSVLQDVVSDKTYWLNNVLVTAVRGGGYVDITLAGRYYDHDNGYVDVTTDEIFRVYDNEKWPASGILVLTGAPGSAGGNTMARLVVLDGDTYQVEADTDGDGSFDDYTSGPLRWTDI